MSKWAEEQLKSVVSKFKYVWNDALLSVIEVKDFSGEAGSSVRKSKKLVSYEYKMTLVWVCSLMDQTGVKPVATARGTYELPEITDSEPIDEWEVRVSYTQDKDGLEKCLD